MKRKEGRKNDAMRTSCLSVCCGQRDKKIERNECIKVSVVKQRKTKKKKQKKKKERRRKKKKERRRRKRQ